MSDHTTDQQMAKSSAEPEWQLQRETQLAGMRALGCPGGLSPETQPDPSGTSVEPGRRRRRHRSNCPTARGCTSGPKTPSLPNFEVYHGDCLEILRTLPDNVADAIIMDPALRQPYSIERTIRESGKPEGFQFVRGP